MKLEGKGGVGEGGDRGIGVADKIQAPGTNALHIEKI